AGLALLALSGLALLASGSIPSVHAYYIPSEAMMPNLVKDDRILAATGVSGRFARGEVILFRTRGGETYIKRLVGVPGDRIAVVAGKVVLNGATIPQQGLRIEEVPENRPSPRTMRLRERLPGEGQPHEIYDSGVSMGDEFPEQIVAPGHLFVMGDNRDNSADSRFGPELGGVGQIAIADVTGRAPVYTWARGRKFGQPVR
ncbi:MAG TPA: signal peptidase I, partial [Allosphingosinicella sp.]|nr:signal peptidase I [Allosphingosinicella sp.]